MSATVTQSPSEAKTITSQLNYVIPLLRHIGDYLIADKSEKEVQRPLIVNKLGELHQLAKVNNLLKERQLVVGLLLPTGEQIKLSSIEGVKLNVEEKPFFAPSAENKTWNPVVIDAVFLWTVAESYLKKAVEFLQTHSLDQELNSSNYPSLVRDYRGAVSAWQETYKKMPSPQSEGYVYPIQQYRPELPGFYR